MKICHYVFLIFLIFIAGCSDLSDYDDTDVAAVVRGEEITVGDLRFLYSDDRILDYLDGTIKAKLAEQEVKELQLDVSKELQEIEETKGVIGLSLYPPEDVDTEFANSSRSFIDSQASKLGMDPEEYAEKHYEITQKTSVYVIAYVEENLGDLSEIGEDYSEKANALLDALAEEYKDDVQIFIK